MNLSQTSEYALRAVVWLADQGDAASATTAQIAEATRVPAGYLSKVLQALARAGLVVPQRGPGGGFTLAQPPRELTVLDVVNAVDPPKPIVRCPLGYDGHASQLCPLHSCLQEAGSVVERVFSRTKISDLLAPSRRRRALCTK